MHTYGIDGEGHGIKPRFPFKLRSNAVEGHGRGKRRPSGSIISAPTRGRDQPESFRQYLQINLQRQGGYLLMDVEVTNRSEYRQCFRLVVLDMTNHTPMFAGMMQLVILSCTICGY
jgi:hypothetical protein